MSSSQDKSSLLKTYAPRLQAFEKEVKKEWINEKAFYRLMSYLRLESEELPLVDSDRYSEFKSIDSILSPFQQWSEIDHRVFQFMTAKGWAYGRRMGGTQIREGFYLSFFRWYRGEVAAGTAPEWSIMETMLLERGIDQEDLTLLMFEGMDSMLMDENGNLTHFGDLAKAQYLKSSSLLPAALQTNIRSGEGLSACLNQFLTETGDTLSDALAQQGFLVPTHWNHHATIMAKRLLALGKNKAHIEPLIPLLIKLPERNLSCLVLAQAIDQLFGKLHETEVIGLIHKAFQEDVVDNWTYFDFSTNKRIDAQEEMIRWVVKAFTEAGKAYIISYLKENQSSYKRDFSLEKLIIDIYGQDAIGIAGQFLEENPTEAYGFFQTQKAYSLIQNYDLSDYEAVFHSMLNSGLKSFMKLGAEALQNIWGEKATAKWEGAVFSKDKKERQGAVYGLISQNDEQAKKILFQVLEKEKDELIRNTAATYMYQGEEMISYAEIERRIATAEKRGKLKKASKNWLDQDALGPLYWENGEQLSERELRYLLYIQRDWQPVSFHPEAKGIFQKIDRNTSSDFALELLKQVQANGGLYAKNRFALVLIAYLGDERILPTFQGFSIEKRNPTAASLIGFQASLEAARALDAIMLAFKTKYPNVREAAQEAFDQIAQNRGISRFELMDEMIPNLGFEGLFRSFESKDKTYRAFIGKNLKMQFLDEDNKVRKSLPASISPDLKNEIKAINKSLRELTKGLKERLERALVLQRRWTYEQWQTFFLGKPLPFAMARALVWGVYEDGQLKAQFSVTDDQEFEDAGYDEIEISASAAIGLIHPMELEAETRLAWEVYLKENKLAPAFPQMSRPIYSLLPEEKELKELMRFAGKKTKVTRFKSRMEKAGWRRGAVIDAGGVENYFLELKTAKMDASIALDDMGVAIYDYDEETTLQGLVFVAYASGRTGAYGTYWYQDHNEDLVNLGDVPEIIMSEVLADLNGLFDN